MKFNAFDTLAGSSYGTWTLDDVLEEMISILKQTNQAHHADRIAAEYGDASENGEADQEWVDEAIYEVIEYLEYSDMEKDAYTSIVWEDGELRVMPYIDEELPRVADVPEDYDDELGGEFYAVNDHGNVCLYQWCDGEYRYIWGMV